MANQNPARIVELDSLRGLAALVVVLFHYTWRFGEMFPAEPHLPYGTDWGRYGVLLFFSISGFVIFMTIDRTKKLSDFLVSRFSRLYPTYWACIVITMAALALLPVEELNQPLSIAAANLSMIHGFFALPSVDGVYWSLLVELCFYACMVALWQLKLLKAPEWVLFGWITLKLLWWQMPDLPYRLELLLVVQDLPFFAIGMASYRIWIGARSLLQQLPLLLWGLIAIMIVDGMAPTLAYVAVSATMLMLAHGWLKWFANPALLWLGAISYPLYLLHQNIGFSLILRIQQAGVTPIIAITIAIAISLALAHAVHKMVEQPSLAFIRKWWKRRQRPTELAAA